MSRQGNDPNDEDWLERAIADEARAKVEADARRAAMPLRRVVSLRMSTSDPSDLNRDFWELECGHFVSRRVPLDDNACVWCHVCYAVGMQRAERMMKR